MDRATIAQVAHDVGRSLADGDSRALRRRLRDGTLLHVPGASGLSGDYQGVDAISDLLDRMVDPRKRGLRFTTSTVAQGIGGRLQLRGTFRGQRAGRELTVEAMIEMEVIEGAIREAWLSCVDLTAWDAFWR
jgi:hypothetical protein